MEFLGRVCVRRGLPPAITTPISGGGRSPQQHRAERHISQRKVQKSRDPGMVQHIGLYLASPLYVRKRIPNAAGPSRASVTNIDVALVRNIPSRERLDLQIRGEPFNLLNTRSFLASGPRWGACGSGRSRPTQVADLPRVLQFALKPKFGRVDTIPKAQKAKAISHRRQNP